MYIFRASLWGIAAGLWTTCVLAAGLYLLFPYWRLLYGSGISLENDISDALAIGAFRLPPNILIHGTVLVLAMGIAGALLSIILRVINPKAEQVRSAIRWTVHQMGNHFLLLAGILCVSLTGAVLWPALELYASLLGIIGHLYLMFAWMRWDVLSRPDQYKGLPPLRLPGWAEAALLLVLFGVFISADELAEVIGTDYSMTYVLLQLVSWGAFLLGQITLVFSMGPGALFTTLRHARLFKFLRAYADLQIRLAVILFFVAGVPIVVTMVVTESMFATVQAALEQHGQQVPVALTQLVQLYEGMASGYGVLAVLPFTAFAALATGRFIAQAAQSGTLTTTKSNVLVDAETPQRAHNQSRYIAQP